VRCFLGLGSSLLISDSSILRFRDLMVLINRSTTGMGIQLGWDAVESLGRVGFSIGRFPTKNSSMKDSLLANPLSPRTTQIYVDNERRGFLFSFGSLFFKP
jgi:hypothetical protein